MTDRAFPTHIDRALGVLGLFLMLVVARFADRAYSAPQTVAGRLSGFAARRAIDGAAVIGWLVDRLPLPATRRVAVEAGNPPADPGGAASA